jgi:uncharacterized membrane protein
MSKLLTFPGGMMLGAGLMYFLDPVRGRRRRARVNEVVHHAERVERELFAKASRDAQQRVVGLTERVKHRPSPDAPDTVITQRVRARLGRAVSHARAIDVMVLDGRAIVSGPILEREAATAIAITRKTRGVIDVIDRLERHMHPGRVAELQGEGRPPRRARGTWPPVLQAGATGAGGLLLAYGLLLKRGLLGALLGGGGAALALRGTVNKPVPTLLGVGANKRGVTVNKTITVRAPIHVVFDLWSRLDNFPMFMQHVREVDIEIGGRKTRWIVDGPAGTQVDFEAETIEFEPDRVIAWRTLPNQSVEHEGCVRFQEVDGATRVHVEMTYRPPGGVVGHAIAHILGWDPKARMDDDLVRMKALLEDGKTRAHDERIALVDLH